MSQQSVPLQVDVYQNTIMDTKVCITGCTRYSEPFLTSFLSAKVQKKERKKF